MSIKEDIFVVILRYGVQRSPDGVTYNEIYNLLQSKGYLTQTDVDSFTVNLNPHDSVQYPKKIKIDWLIEEIFPRFDHNSGKRGLSVENYFRLVELDELTEARKNGAEAKRLAITAIIISVVSAFASIYMTYWQSSNAVTIDRAQFDKLVQSRPVTLESRQFEELRKVPPATQQTPESETKHPRMPASPK